ncbi:MAG: hypothetical protein Q7U82_00415 [Gammaproteobacteria bacterium]|nr:hypothetical protein [Gammaproteobacteria bacterium]
MANGVKALQIGVDVSKNELVISEDGQPPFALPNTAKAIKSWSNNSPLSVRLR